MADDRPPKADFLKNLDGKQPLFPPIAVAVFRLFSVKIFQKMLSAPAACRHTFMNQEDAKRDKTPSSFLCDFASLR